MYYHPFMRPPLLPQQMVAPQPVAPSQPMPQPAVVMGGMQNIGASIAHRANGTAPEAAPAQQQPPNFLQALGQRIFASDKPTEPAPAQPEPDEDSLAKRAMKNG